MSTNNTTADKNHAVVAVVDDTDYDNPHYIIADLNSDDAWIAMPADKTLDMATWQ